MLEIGLAVTRHRRSIIFRREADQVRDLWQKLSDVCGGLGRSNENLLIWRDLPGDRYVRLAGVKNPNDWRKYAGQGHDLFAFDEATEFLETQVRTLIAWNRTTIRGQRCRVVLSFNPPTSVDGEWVIRFFGPWLDPQHPNPAEPGELRWYAVVDDEDVERPDGRPFEHNGEVITPRSRTFIPARLEDNPLLEATGYRATLQGLPEPLRSQMLYGDFTIGQQDDAMSAIPASWIRQAQSRWSEDGHGNHRQTAVGVDVARGGSDRTVLARRRGHWFAFPEAHPGATTQDGMAVATLIARVLVDGGAANIDVIGVGASAYDVCRLQRLPVWPVNNGAGAKDIDGTPLRTAGGLTFANVRAAAMWSLREALDPSGDARLQLPPDRELLADLAAPHWKAVGGRISIESKDEVKARLGRSPDKGDACVLAWWTDPAYLAAVTRSDQPRRRSLQLSL